MFFLSFKGDLNRLWVISDPKSKWLGPGKDSGEMTLFTGSIVVKISSKQEDPRQKKDSGWTTSMMMEASSDLFAPVWPPEPQAWWHQHQEDQGQGTSLHKVTPVGHQEQCQEEQETPPQVQSQTRYPITSYGCISFLRKLTATKSWNVGCC